MHALVEESSRKGRTTVRYQECSYTVVSVKALDASRLCVESEDVPEHIRARFYGKRFTCEQLAGMGVEIRGGMAIVRDADCDWVLNLSPDP